MSEKDLNKLIDDLMKQIPESQRVFAHPKLMLVIRRAQQLVCEEAEERISQLRTSVTRW